MLIRIGSRIGPSYSIGYRPIPSHRITSRTSLGMELPQAHRQQQDRQAGEPEREQDRQREQDQDGYGAHKGNRQERTSKRPADEAGKQARQGAGSEPANGLVESPISPCGTCLFPPLKMACCFTVRVR